MRIALYAPAYDYSDRLAALDMLARGQRREAEALLEHLRYIDDWCARSPSAAITLGSSITLWVDHE